jgi:hypothetical protein
VSLRLPCLIFVRVCGWMVLLGRSSSSKNAWLLVLRHEVAVPIPAPARLGRLRGPRRADPVGAENLCRLGRCLADGGRLGLAFDVGRASLGLAGGGMIFGLWA